MSVSLIIDIVIAIICLIIIIKNAIRGFIKSFIIFAKTIMAFLAAYIFNAPLARFLSSKFFNTLAYGWVHNSMMSTNNGSGEYYIYKLFEGIPNWFTNIILKNGLDEETIQKYIQNKESASAEVMEELSVSLGNSLSLVITTVISCLALFIVAEIVFTIIGALLNKARKLPVMNVVNISLGILIGAAFSAVIAWLITLGAGYVIKFGANYNPEIFNDSIIQNSVIMKFFSENNLWHIVRDFVENNRILR